MFKKKGNIYMLLFLVFIMLIMFFMLKYSFGKQNKNEAISITNEKLEELVSDGIKSRASSYMDGEKVTEGHLILGTEIKDNLLKVYTISSLGTFGFENNIFTIVSGSGEIPTVLTFENKNNWEMIEYKEPLDGSGYGDSLKKMFPKEIYEEILSNSGSFSGEIKKQKVEQASEYLRSIKRVAEINPDYVEKKLFNINVEASNILFSELTKYDEFLNNCPYWIGTVERIENGNRYIYESFQGKSKEDSILIVFKKTDNSGKVIREERYKIEGPNVIKIEDN